jgi:Zn-dependent protease/CBS domain-containing protein
VGDDARNVCLHSQIKLGRIGGIEIGLHYSWFIIAILIAFSLAGNFKSVSPGWSPEVIWGAAIITSVLFFVTLLLHELAHSMVAKAYGLRVRAITLFALGGVSQIESESPKAIAEFWIAIVGPISSAILGGIFIGLARLTGSPAGTKAETPITSVLLWLGYINLSLAAFNMIPGYPLDGGRVLRAILWWISGSVEKATRWASQVGQGVAFLFIVFGLFRFFVGENFGGLWIAFIGWFLLDAARSSSMQLNLMAGLRGRRVSDIMERNCASVEGYLSLRDFIDEYVLHSGSRCFVVTSNNQTVGLITPADARTVPRESWEQTSVQSVMTPLRQVRSVPPDMPADKAVELMARDNLPQLAVLADGKLQGMFTQNQVLRFLQIYTGPEPNTPYNRSA